MVFMNWIDNKLDDRDRHKPKTEDRSTDTVRQHKRDLAAAAETWGRVVDAVRSDIAKFNAKSPARRVNVSATPEFISLDCNNPPQEALLVSRKLHETTATYAAPDRPKQRTPHEGTINLLTENAESLSEKLLSSVLFD